MKPKVVSLASYYTSQGCDGHHLECWCLYYSISKTTFVHVRDNFNYDLFEGLTHRYHVCLCSEKPPNSLHVSVYIVIIMHVHAHTWCCPCMKKSVNLCMERSKACMRHACVRYNINFKHGIYIYMQ